MSFEIQSNIVYATKKKSLVETKRFGFLSAGFVSQWYSTKSSL